MNTSQPLSCAARLSINFFLLGLAGALTFIGCSSSSHPKRGSLSEAMAKSSDTYKGERRVASSRIKSVRTRRVDRGPVIVVSTPVDVAVHRHHEPEVVYTRPRPSGTTFFGISAFSTGINEEQLSNVSGGTIHFGTYTSRNSRHSLGLGLGFFPMTENNYLYNSVANPGEVHLAYQYRRYANNWFPLTPYAKLELAPQVRFWSYRNPIQSDVVDEYGYYLGTETVTGDGLLGFTVGTGLGFAILKSRDFELGLDGTLGFNFLSRETTAGFINDFFYDELFMKLSVEVDFK